MKEVLLHPLLWGTVGLAIMFAELLAPGIYLVFVGIAAAAIAVILLAFPNIPFLLVGVIFLSLVILSVLFGRRIYSNSNSSSKSQASAAELNDRSSLMVGKIATVLSVTDATSGQVKLGDTSWRAHWSQTPNVGDEVSVLSVKSTTLIVSAKLDN